VVEFQWWVCSVEQQELALASSPYNVQVASVFFGANLAFHRSEIDLSQMQQENQAAQVQDDLESMVVMASSSESRTTALVNAGDPGTGATRDGL